MGERGGGVDRSTLIRVNILLSELQIMSVNAGREAGLLSFSLSAFLFIFLLFYFSNFFHRHLPD